MRETLPLYNLSGDRVASWSRSSISILVFFLVGMSYIDFPGIHLGGEVDLGIEDIIFFLLLFGAYLSFMMRRMDIRKEYFLISAMPLVALLYVIIGLFASNNPHRVLFEYQPFMFYFSFLFPLILTKDVDEIERILKAIVLVTVIFIPLLYLQYFLASSDLLFIAGKSRGMNWMAGNVRFVPKSDSILLLVSFYFIWKNLQRLKLVNLIILAAFIMALALTYSRNLWVSFMIGGLVIVWYEKREIFKRLPIMIAAAVLGLTALILLFNDTLMGQRIMTRAGMISADALNADTSLMWRVYETKSAMESIKESPLLGSGLGYLYHERQNFPGAEYYIHNSYLYIWMKMGIVGFIAMGAFIYGFMKDGMHVYRAYKDKHIIAGVAMSSVAYMAAIIPAEIVQPRLTQNIVSIIMLSVLCGIFMKLRTLYNRERRVG